MSEARLIAKAMNEGKPVQDLVILPALANRHGLITGATGTGKTVTLQRMAEQFSRIGIPVFLADVKGDLSGIGMSRQRFRICLTGKHLSAMRTASHLG